MDLIRHHLMEAINIWASVIGCIGLVASLVLQDRSRKDWVEVLATAFFIFMQSAMWGAWTFYVVSVILRLTGHGLVIP